MRTDLILKFTSNVFHISKQNTLRRVMTFSNTYPSNEDHRQF